MRTFGSFGSRKDESLDERPVSSATPRARDILRVGGQGPVAARIGTGAGAGARGVRRSDGRSRSERAERHGRGAGDPVPKETEKRALQIIHSYLDRAHEPSRRIL